MDTFTIKKIEIILQCGHSLEITHNMENLVSYVLITLMGIGGIFIGFCLATVLYHCNGIQQRYDLINIERSIINLREKQNHDNEHSFPNKNKLEVVTTEENNV